MTKRIQRIQLPLRGDTLSRLAVLNGYEGVAHLSATIGFRRNSLYGGLKNPAQYPQVVKDLSKALPLRAVRPPLPGTRDGVKPGGEKPRTRPQ